MSEPQIHIDKVLPLGTAFTKNALIWRVNMKIIPVLYIKNRFCIKLIQKKYQTIDIYSHSPIKIAKNWQAQGVSCLHIIDLDGAFIGHAVNEEIIREVINQVSIPIQIGGNIRSIKEIERILNLGADKVILGTMAIESPAFIREAVQLFGSNKIIVAINAKNGIVALDNREKLSTVPAVELAKKMRKIGVKTVIYEDSFIDAAKGELNTKNIVKMQQIPGLQIIASGEFTSIKDLERLDYFSIYAVTIKALLYENTIDLKKAVNQFERHRNEGR